MDLNTSLQTNGKGPSRTIFVSDTIVLIRQHTQLSSYDITTKTKLQQIQIDEVYDEQPCGYWENKYIEVSEKHVIEIDLKTQKKKSKKIHFEQEFDSPSSFQAGSILYVFNVGHLYIIDLNNLTLSKGFVVPNARQATMTVLGPTQLGLYVYDEGSLHVIDTGFLGSRKVFFKSPMSEGQIIGINLSELLLFGPSQDGTRGSCIVKANIERQDEDIELATLEHQIHDCQADVRGQRLAITDISGQLHIFSFTFACSYTENLTSFAIKPTDRWSAVSTVQKQGKHDIFRQQLETQCENFKKVVQAGKPRQMQQAYEETKTTLKNLVEGVTQTKGTYLEVLTQLRNQLGARTTQMMENVERLRQQLKSQEQELEETVKRHREKQRESANEGNKELLAQKKKEVQRHVEELKRAEMARIDQKIRQMRAALEEGERVT